MADDKEKKAAAAAEASDQGVRSPDVAPKPGDKVLNPAQPLAETVIPEDGKADAFVQDAANFPGYPKKKWHPVHGGITLENPNQEAGLLTPTDWFDTPELADASRTWTEAHAVGAQNTRAKLAALDEAGRFVVRNSVQAHEAAKSGRPEPL